MRTVWIAISVVALGAGCGQSEEAKPMATGMAELPAITTYVNMGDSVAAGLWAGQDLAYSKLLYQNHASYPAYAGHSITGWFETAEYHDISVPGAATDDVLTKQVPNLPPASGDVVVTIYIGGNDVTANPYNLFTDDGIQFVIDGYVEHMDGVIRALKHHYQGEGRNLIVVLATVHDPTDGQGSIPAQFNAGFCGTISQIPPDLYDEALHNFGVYNDAIKAFAAEHGALVFDSHDMVLDHGMNASDEDRWLSDDCIHFNDEGHNQLRRGFWQSLTGEMF